LIGNAGRIVVSFMRPVVASRTRWVALVGISCHNGEHEQPADGDES